jgi:hypothetical protein
MPASSLFQRVETEPLRSPLGPFCRDGIEHSFGRPSIVFAVTHPITYNSVMHRINDAVVRGGKLVLSDLPFAEGQHVQVIVAEVRDGPLARVPISEVRSALRGGVERYDDPFEPSIPPESWEMLK